MVEAVVEDVVDGLEIETAVVVVQNTTGVLLEDKADVDVDDPIEETAVVDEEDHEAQE